MIRTVEETNEDLSEKKKKKIPKIILKTSKD